MEQGVTFSGDALASQGFIESLVGHSSHQSRTKSIRLMFSVTKATKRITNLAKTSCYHIPTDGKLPVIDKNGVTTVQWHKINFASSA